MAVTGVTAGTYDFNHQMRARLPYVFLFVLGLAFVLLLLDVPLARDRRDGGRAQPALGRRRLRDPRRGLPARLARGRLSASRRTARSSAGCRSSSSSSSSASRWTTTSSSSAAIKELHDAGASTDDAIRLAITRTAGTVTSAAIIMVAVFGLFATLSLIMMQQMGFGLAVAVLIDATVVRAVLVPATMKLLGEWNWYLPRGSSGCRRSRRRTRDKLRLRRGPCFTDKRGLSVE